MKIYSTHTAVAPIAAHVDIIRTLIETQVQDSETLGPCEGSRALTDALRTQGLDSNWTFDDLVSTLHTTYPAPSLV
jgi:hypothetical protein